jgi:hypothetical protein
LFFLFIVHEQTFVACDVEKFDQCNQYGNPFVGGCLDPDKDRRISLKLFILKNYSLYFFDSVKLKILMCRRCNDPIR